MLRMTVFGPEEIEKKCNTCNEVKKIEEFYPRSYHYGDTEARRGQCKECWNRFNGRSNFSNVAMFEVK